MKNGFDNEDQGIQIFQQENCRVSYILNNDQPVRCSIIGDQPLFYMDFEDAVYEEEDESAFDDLFGIEQLEHKIETLKEKIMATHAGGVEDSDAYGKETARLFFEDSSALTRPFYAEVSRESEKERLDLLLETLGASRLAAAYMEIAVSHGVRVRFSRQEAMAGYDRENKAILVNPDRPFPDQLLLTARELRRVWQHKQGALIHPLTFHPDQAVLVNRAQIADLMVNVVRIAWELQLSGKKEAWERIENSAMADLAQAFARESCLDFRTLNNGVACSAVFESWFLSERCCHEDKALIQLMLADYSGYVFDAEQPSKQITAGLIIALGSMPFGKNYLAPFVNTIMNDAVFTEVRDRSNANFLWFIKFERSFRETEQELQTGDDVCARENLHDRALNKNNRLGDDGKTANIIPFHKGGATDTRVRQRAAAGRSNKQNEKIVYLQEEPEE